LLFFLKPGLAAAGLFVRRTAGRAGMSTAVVALVLCAALLHASWNAVLKSGADRLRAITIMAIGAGLGALPLILLAPLPRLAAWPYILLSAVLHVGYNLFLIRAYRAGDFSQAYPIARGSSPLLVALGAAVFAGEIPGWLTLGGVVLVSAGIISLARIRPAAGTKMPRHSPAAALATGAFIAAYTVVDGIGSRLNGGPGGYAGWLFVLDGLFMAVLFAVLRRAPLANPWSRETRRALGGGVMSLFAYGIVIWALTLAPMGPVSALRETSVLFAMLIGRLFMHEKLTARRISACVVIACGAICLGWAA
jgi:drug/metabolite transporter (DMT)-like permease